MNAIVFIGVIFCLGLVVFWYVANVEARAKGEKGLLAVGEKPPELDEPAYRHKKRRTGARFQLEKKSAPSAAYRALGDKKAAFHPKDESAYRAKARRPHTAPDKK
ncbi:MAG TPA: hypothetical protein VNH64_08525 [Parvularculaceae bacterium]|nr:hypothetical protein [Parvularculaceae bacterium]